jgi:hypothetical protein
MHHYISVYAVCAIMLATSAISFSQQTGSTTQRAGQVIENGRRSDSEFDVKFWKLTILMERRNFVQNEPILISHYLENITKRPMTIVRYSHNMIGIWIRVTDQNGQYFWRKPFSDEHGLLATSAMIEKFAPRQSRREQFDLLRWVALPRPGKYRLKIWRINNSAQTMMAEMSVRKGEQPVVEGIESNEIEFEVK